MAYASFLQALLQRSSNDPIQLSPMPQTPAAVNIPEILERILASVDQETLLNTARLVCRTWHAVSKRLLRRELIFEWPMVVGPPPSPEPQSLMKAIWQKGASAFDPPVYPRRRGESPVFEGLADLDPAWLSKLPRATTLRLFYKRTGLNITENRAVWRAIYEALGTLGQQNQHQYHCHGLEALWVDSKRGLLFWTISCLPYLPRP